MTSLITKTGSAAVLALLLCGAAQAQQAPVASSDSDWRFFGVAGATFGGDTLASIQYDNGDSEKLKAGGSLQLGIGAEYKTGTDWSIQASAGYHNDSVKAINVKASFTRFPFEILAMYDVNPQLRLGAGFRYVNSPVVKATGVSNLNFDNAIGTVFEGEFYLNDTKKVALTLRYVKEAFKFKGGGTDIDGSHFGVGVKAYF